MVKEVRGNMSGFCRYFSNKISRESTGPLLNMARNLEGINTEEAKAIMIFSTWSLLKKNCLQESVKTVGDARARKLYPCWRVRLGNSYRPWKYQVMESHGMLSKLPRQLLNVTARPVSLILERPW